MKSLVVGDVRPGFRSTGFRLTGFNLMEGTDEPEGSGGAVIVGFSFAEMVGVAAQGDAGCAWLFSHGLADGGHSSTHD